MDMKNRVSKVWSDQALHALIRSSQFLTVRDYVDDLSAERPSVIFKSKTLNIEEIEAGAYDFEEFVTSLAPAAIAESIDTEVFEALAQVSRGRNPLPPHDLLTPFYPALIHSKIEEGYSVIVSNVALLKYPNLRPMLEIDGVKLVRSHIPELLVIDLNETLNVKIGGMTALRTHATDKAINLFQEIEFSIKITKPEIPPLRIGNIPCDRNIKNRKDYEVKSKEWANRPSW